MLEFLQKLYFRYSTEEVFSIYIDTSITAVELKELLRSKLEPNVEPNNIELLHFTLNNNIIPVKTVISLAGKFKPNEILTPVFKLSTILPNMKLALQQTKHDFQPCGKKDVVVPSKKVDLGQKNKMEEGN